MGRVIEPLSAVGAEIVASPGGRLPLMLRGASLPLPLRYRLPVASAQVKSAVLLAGLNIQGETVVEEPVATRDHSERMLKGYGADLRVEPMADGGRAISVRGWAELKPQQIRVPGDPSSAAFPMVAALLVPGSDLLIEGVGLNPTRDGLARVLSMMGADIERLNPREVGGEPVADLRVRHSALTGLEVPPEIAPSMIDEYPILFVAAALARGRTVMRGIEELRVKESDRIAVMARGLRAAGVCCEELPDGLIVEGRGGELVPGGVTVAAELDHRIAMSFAILSLAARAPVTVDDRSPIQTSFPTFTTMMRAIGAREA
jgi:3-phosphoshikimate 1-carboxyvinyltransferase